MTENNDNFDNMDNQNLSWHTLFSDFIDKNHIASQRVVPELLGEFDNAWDVQQQLAYVLASLRRLARDQSIITHEFDSVTDGLLDIVNKIMSEFANEMTAEINKLWVEVNLLYKRKITFITDDTLNTSVVGNWQNGDTELKVTQIAVLDPGTKALNLSGLANYTVSNSLSKGKGLFAPDFSQPVIALNTKINKEIQDRIDAINAEAKTRGDADIVLQQHIDAEAKTRGNADTVLQQHIDAEAKTRSDADVNLQRQITNINNFVAQLIRNLSDSGAYNKNDTDVLPSNSIGKLGVFNGHVAYGNINAYGGAQGGTNGIFTQRGIPNQSFAVGN